MSRSTEPMTVPQMVLIGAAGRNSGKTTLACQLIRAWKEVAPIYALKVIAIDRADGTCQRGEAGCGICTSLRGSFELVRETGEYPAKDTAQMLRAGASEAFLLKCLRSAMEEAICCTLAQIPKGAILIVESNTLRKHLIPGVFLFAGGGEAEAMKPSARAVYEKANLVLSPGAEDVAQALCLRQQADGGMMVSLK